MSFRPSDIPALLLAMESAQRYIAETPLPGQPAEVEDLESLAEGEVPNDPAVP